MSYKDYMVRATCANAQIRAFAATTKDLAEYGRKAHGLSPIAAAALGRLMTGTVMMGTMMDNDDVIPKNAIYEMVKALNNDKTIDMI